MKARYLMSRKGHRRYHNSPETFVKVGEFETLLAAVEFAEARGWRWCDVVVINRQDGPPSDSAEDLKIAYDYIRKTGRS